MWVHLIKLPSCLIVVILAKYTNLYTPIFYPCAWKVQFVVIFLKYLWIIQYIWAAFKFRNLFYTTALAQPKERKNTIHFFFGWLCGAFCDAILWWQLSIFCLVLLIITQNRKEDEQIEIENENKRRATTTTEIPRNDENNDKNERSKLIVAMILTELDTNRCQMSPVFRRICTCWSWTQSLDIMWYALPVKVFTWVYVFFFSRFVLSFIHLFTVLG